MLSGRDGSERDVVDPLGPHVPFVSESDVNSLYENKAWLNSPLAQPRSDIFAASQPDFSGISNVTIRSVIYGRRESLKDFGYGQEIREG
ncbi:hypothetical protein BEWA_029000 [Theileria equi strain WA]|uniref:Uncharacterized protein n=1 Tax=Theileria equi strain WA TaxID=1537102 RepID=L0AWX0_THEEQ|nr:hypothetical protein BEWA_029000 [Theileria equi strain WA]AFZ80050.1 hypothetical protein BEWA_029000 [Theileria equi strain WA]|eukprot:XP_004829716.1 hypothetical protein BEWA_029000 [Theileria equi strain WA]